MSTVMNVLIVTLEEGLMYALMALGVYITYSILDFPDLSVDGTFPLGAILIYTGCLSINLVLLLKGTGGKAIVTFFNNDTIFNSSLGAFIPESIGGFYLRTTIVSLILVIICKIVLDLFLKTKSGLLIRATGDNERFVTMLGKDNGKSKILGLALGNGFAALSGSVIAQSKGSADQQMGVGMVVLALASVIIGLSVFKKAGFMKATTMVILGSVLYKGCLSVALAVGLPTEYLKLLMAIIFTAALVLSTKLSGKRISNAVRSGD